MKLEFSDIETLLIEKRRCISIISQEKVVKCLASFYDQLTKAADDLQTPSQSALTTMLETSLSAYIHHISEFPELLRIRAESVKSLRKHHVQILCGFLSRINVDKSSIERPTVRSEMFVVLEGMISYSDLLTHPQVSDGMYVYNF